MNNLIKNVAIWLVIALVLMTVFNQFSTRQAGQKAMEYSQFIEEVKQGNVAKVTIEGRVLKGVKRSGERRKQRPTHEAAPAGDDNAWFHKRLGAKTAMA